MKDDAEHRIEELENHIKNAVELLDDAVDCIKIGHYNAAKKTIIMVTNFLRDDDE